jgi:hypothetical protein
VVVAVVVRVVAADQAARLAESYGVPTIQARTAAQVSGIQAQDSARAEAERQRQLREQEKAAAERANMDAVTLAQGIRDRVAGVAPGAADPTGVIPLLTQIAQALSNGTNAVEQANISAQLSAAIGRLTADQAATRALLEQVRSQLANNPTRG